MSFYLLDDAPKEVQTTNKSSNTGCSACSLNDHEIHLTTPKMNATGPDMPHIYVLGEAPGTLQRTKTASSL